MAYTPPFSISNDILNMVVEISGLLGRLEVTNPDLLSPQLRRGNRIKTIQASLAIENNTLSVEQVTAVIEGKRVLGLPREIQEVNNAFSAYEKIADWSDTSVDHLLSAHGNLMFGLDEQAGSFRRGGVGIYRGETLIHMPPQANRVPVLIAELMDWLERTDVHPLIASCIFHYEFEFIHPFSDGNGRMGRLWQTLVLSKWQPLFAYVPVETVIRDKQDEYYQALADSDRLSESSPFIGFMLKALLTALKQIDDSPVEPCNIDELDNAVQRVINVLSELGAVKLVDLMASLELKHRPTFKKGYLDPAIKLGLVEMSNPDKPRSPNQLYRLTSLGKKAVKR
ncbi:Fic family protein [Vibrio tapetis]|uniref:Cell division protein Fic n=1 Tax=Vibrio tapetis subsp. tapetis TaxID=1671868 RepID=A0A2N8ZBT0_9VIBR|nr:Fic family protein [Vibrio tapetis]SON49365.1 Cell division protein Fic [Vibrio tapetis subsp. tapetis]